MNRFVRAATAAAVLGFGALGCTHSGGKTCGDKYRDYVDPSWPERYNSVARQEVIAPFATQVNNGHVMNQTVWNWHFEQGSDKLTEAGVQKLDSLARTRPGLDPRVYIQTARDLPVTPDSVSQVAGFRTELDARRAGMVQKYMGAQPGSPAVEVFVHDPVVPGISAEFAGAAYRGMASGYRGGITGAAGVTTLGTSVSNTTVINTTSPGAGGGAGGTSVTGSSTTTNNSSTTTGNP